MEPLKLIVLVWKLIIFCYYLNNAELGFFFFLCTQLQNTKTLVMFQLLPRYDFLWFFQGQNHQP